MTDAPMPDEVDATDVGGTPAADGGAGPPEGPARAVPSADPPEETGADLDLDEVAEEFEVDLEALLQEREEFLSAYQRVAADFDNYRKQAQKRLDDEVTRSIGSFVERLLPVLDAIEAARAHGSDDVEAVANQLFGFLEKEGLERVAPAGETFDPNVAEAVMHEPGDGDPIVTEVLRTGYLFRGRVLRAAMVKVSG